MEYVEQTPKDLEYRMFDKAIDLSQVELLRTKNYTVEEHSVTLHIIGESHILSIDNNLTEIFACVSLKEEPILYKDFRDGKRAFLSETINGFKFVTTVMFYDYDKDKPIVDLYLKHFKESDLKVLFPMQDEVPFEAVTAMKINTEINDLFFYLETIHSYPNENILVSTVTKIQKVS